MLQKKVKIKFIKPHIVKSEAHFSLGQMLVVAVFFAGFGILLLWHSFAATALVEKAYGKPTSASSIAADGYGRTLQPWYANDGSTTVRSDGKTPSRWSSIASNNQWWRVDLGSKTTVSRVDITWETAYASHYYIEGSNDGTTYFRLADVYSSQAGLKSTSFTETSARYIRVYGLTRGTQWGFSIWEAKVYGSSPTSVTAGIINPVQGSTVANSIPVEAKASTSSSATKVARVDFYLDGSWKKSESAAPYCLAGDSGVAPCYGWDTKAVPNGTHTLTAYAYDNLGNKSAASTVTFTVLNQTTTPPTGNNLSLGTYMGPANVTGHNQFSTWLGWEAYVAEDFIDDSQTWYNIANNSNWLLDPWSQWVKAKQGRRMVVAMPMLNQASSGQLYNGANGAFDAYFRTLAQNMVNKGLGQSIIRLGWEANGDWYPWRASVDQASWKAYYRRIVGIMRSVQPTVAGQPAQAFKFDFNFNLGNSGTAVTFSSLYPGDDVVDYIGLDAYDVKWQDGWNGTALATPDVRWNNLLYQAGGLNDLKAFASAHGKLMSLPEWGLWPRGTQDGGGGDNSYYIDRVADWIAANRSQIAYHSYFNHLSGGGDGDHRLSTYPNSQARFLARFGVNAP